VQMGPQVSHLQLPFLSNRLYCVNSEWAPPTGARLASERTSSFVSIGRDPVVPFADQRPDILLPHATQAPALASPEHACAGSLARPGGSALFWPIIVLPLSELRANSAFRVNRWSWPDRPPIPRQASQSAPTSGASQTGSGQEREAGRGLPEARKDSYAGDLRETLCASFVSFVRFVVGP
jgi:hypothetical protein